MDDSLSKMETRLANEIGEPALPLAYGLICNV